MSVLQQLQQAHKDRRERLLRAGLAKSPPKPCETNGSFRESAQPNHGCSVSTVTSVEPTRGPLEVMETFVTFAPKIPTMKQIISVVCRKHGVSPLELISRRRHRKLVLARHEAMWMARNQTSLSYPQIGERLGGRDHTTILHGVRMHQKRLDEET